MSRLFDHIGTGTLDQAYHDQNDDDGYIGDIGLPSGVTITDREIAESAAADRTGPDAEPYGVADLCRELWPEAF